MNKKDRREYMKEWTRKHPESCRKKCRDCAQRKKLAIHELLGKRCAHCGFDDIRALQIDHVNSNGSEERKIVKGRGSSMYTYMLKKINDGSKDYQLLCANCNWIKRFENKEFPGRPKLY